MMRHVMLVLVVIAQCAVLDGRQAARALVDIESFMNTVLVAELRNATSRRPTATADAEWPAPVTEPLAAA